MYSPVSCDKNINNMCVLYVLLSVVAGNDYSTVCCRLHTLVINTFRRCMADGICDVSPVVGFLVSV